MMRLPIIDQQILTRGNATEQFGGLNQNIKAAFNEWADMRNISSRYFPAIGSRPDRGPVELELQEPHGIFYKNGLFYIDGDEAYYKGTQVFSVTQTDKILVGMGAYICVFPDNIMYNTYTGTYEHMDVTFDPSTAAFFAPLSDDSSYSKITVSGIGNSFKKGDNVTISGCQNEMFNGTHIIIDADTDYIVLVGALDAAFTQNSGLSFKRNIPVMDFVAERDNRLWGCSSLNHEVYCCKVGDPKNWYNYETGADMAWAATVGSDGDFTGITKFSTYMMFFKESAVHILRGDKPANFALTEKALPGVRRGCERSVLSINETLYYVSRDGVYRYNGAIPQKISNSIVGEITDAVAGQYDSKYYLSCRLNGQRKLLVFDPSAGIWDIEDETQFLFAAYSEGMLHIVDQDNKLRSIYTNTESEDFEWLLESVEQTGGNISSGYVNSMSFNAMDCKYLSSLKFMVYLPQGSEMFVYTKCDDEPKWTKRGYVRSTRSRTYTIPIMPRRCTKYKIRLSGRGQFRLLGMSHMIEAGTEFNGNIHFGYRH